VLNLLSSRCAPALDAAEPPGPFMDRTWAGL
jgi:hypothetical protein